MDLTYEKQRGLGKMKTAVSQIGKVITHEVNKKNFTPENNIVYG